ncbi:MAG: hypothetical protein QE277_04120, partial [Flectobacillus sp.]|nr:hypothetical protein [Flectobacillus sp.]
CSPLPISNRAVKPSHVDDTAITCGKVNKLQIIIQAEKATSKGWLFAYITTNNKYKENKQKPQQEISLRLYHVELLTKSVNLVPKAYHYNVKISKSHRKLH